MAGKQAEERFAAQFPLQCHNGTPEMTEMWWDKLAGLNPTMDIMGSLGQADRSDQRPPEMPSNLCI